MFPPYYFPCGLVVIGFYLGGPIDKFIGGGSSLLLRGPGAHTGLSISGPMAGLPSQMWLRVIISKPLGGLLPWRWWYLQILSWPRLGLLS